MEQKDKTKVIVTTTINQPNEAIEYYDNLDGWDLLVVGDLKTPSDYKLKNGLYLSPAQQVIVDKGLSDLIGWNCIQRRNFGFLIAHKVGADIVATIDDDNYPNEDWGKDVYVGKETEVNAVNCHDNVLDPLSFTNYPQYWHRGFPIQKIHNRKTVRCGKTTIIPDIQANLWNGSLDVDAYERLLYGGCCVDKLESDVYPFSPSNMFQLTVFDSQNTMISGKYLPYYFMFPFIGRMDDIWASYFVQSSGARVVFDRSTVTQKRNPHTLVNDMKDEFFGYRLTETFIKDVLDKGEYALEKWLPTRSYKAFKRYQSHFE